MSAPKSYSGIVLTQNVTGSPVTFVLPSDYIRGQDHPIIAPLTGFQLFLTVASGSKATASVDYTLQVAGQTISSGSTTGTALDGNVWFSVYFEPVAIESVWLTQAFTLTYSLSGGASVATRLRLLGGVGDSGTDFLGNVYRSALVRASGDNVSVVGDINEVWLSAPSPSQFAVQSLYFDERINDGATVIDRVTIDPLTAGMFAQLYYSNDPTGPGVDVETWDNLLWTPVYKPLQVTRRETYALPHPIVAKYVKVEFTHLQPHSYDPGNFQIPTVYRKFPKWVLDYFLAQFALLERDLLSSGIDITYDALDLAFSYYKSDITQAPDPPALSQDLAAKTLTFFQQENTSQVDPSTLRQIRRSFQPFTSQPSLLGRLGSVLGDYANATATTNYSTEVIDSALGDTSIVSNFEREPLLVEKGFPVMSFYLPSRHAYRLSQAMFEKNIGYFAGVRQLAFHRDLYAGPSDAAQYNEALGDGANLLFNDWELPVPFPLPDADAALILSPAVELSHAPTLFTVSLAGDVGTAGSL